MADDILRLLKIWQDKIENSLDERISDNDSNILLSVLMEIANRMSIRPRFQDIGLKFKKEIASARVNNFDCPLVAAIQVGEDNSMEINCGSSFRGPVTFDIKGKNNKVILCHLLDERKVFECTSSGYLKVVLRSDDPAFQDLAESASNLKIEEINKDPVIKDNNITIIEIKPGNLVMMFFIENNYTLEKNIEWIFQCIFGRHEITQILENQGVDEVRVHGYIYNLKEYCLEFSRQVRALQTEEADKLYKAAKFHSHSHLTWRFGESTCDVDVLLTDLFHNLSIYGLTTEVNENIWVMAKGNIIHPKETAFSSFASMLTETVDEKEREINVQLAKLGHYEMQGIQDAGNSIHFILKTKTGVKYTELVAEDGVILTVMKRLLLFTYLKSEVNLMRIGIVIDTKLMQNQQNQKETYTLKPNLEILALVVKFRSKSTFAESEQKCALPQIFTSVIENLAKADDEIPSRLKIKVELNNEKCEGKMEVAIDIGNIFSGYAFATHDQLKQEPVEIQFSTWDGLSREFISYKTPSNILLDEDRNFVAFGFDAEKRYCDLAEDGQHLNFYYFCRFKMLFNDIAKEKQMTRQEIADVTGKKLSAVLVFSNAVRYFKDHFINTLEKRRTFCRKDDIAWILMIPKIWSDAKKLLIEKAAVEAGIPIDQLTLVSEPEAAMLWYKHFNKEQRSNDQNACKYIALDTGGSVDITLCQHTSNGKLTKVDIVESLQSGSIGVDQAFEKILTDIVGEDFVEQYKQKHPKEYANIFRNFEVRKRLFTREFPTNQKITLKIPVSFAEECRFRLSTDLNLLTNNTKHRDTVFWGKGKLYINYSAFKRLFEPICEDIMQQMQEMLNQTYLKEVNTILMVGGFSDNFILQDVIKNAFPELTVIIPNNAELAVMEGALLFQQNCFDKYEKMDDPDEKQRRKQQIKQTKENQPIPPACSSCSSIIKDRTQFVASIEMGNSFSGYAFISTNDLNRDPLQSMTSFWCTEKGLKTSKVPSTLLLDKDKMFVAFGYEAEAKYMELRDEKEHFDYYYFPRFLSKFHDIYTAHEVITDDMGKQMPTVDVLSIAIKYLYTHCLNAMNLERASFGDIAWVFIVPSHLNDAAIHLFRMAAEKAGICQNNTKIELKSDAASIYFCSILPKRKLPDEEEKDPFFYSGSKYLLLDAGGMTLELTAFEVLPNGKIMELVKRIHGVGGITLENTFKEFLRKIFGDLVLKKYYAEYSDDYLDLLREFEIKKRTFGSRINELPVKRISLNLPYSIIHVYEYTIGEDLKSRINEAGYKDRIKVQCSKLFIDHATFNSFFQHACHETIRYVKTLLTSSKLSGIVTIFMVGGFSESPILQNAMKDAFPKYRIVVAEEPSLAALKGAVLMAGETPIKDRRLSRYTFGVDTFQIFNPSIHNPMKKKTICGVDYCRDIFTKLVRCGDSLSAETHSSQVTYIPIYPNQTEISFGIYKSKNPGILYIDEPGCIYVGKVTVHTPLTSSKYRCVKCSMRFKTPELILTVVYPETGKMITASFDLLDEYM